MISTVFTDWRTTYTYSKADEARDVVIEEASLYSISSYAAVECVMFLPASIGRINVKAAVFFGLCDATIRTPL